MNIIVCDDAPTAARTAARRIRDALDASPTLTLGLATGGTMLPLYADLTRDAGALFAKCETFNLDEYAGLGPDHPGSFHSYMMTHFHTRLTSPPRAMHLPNGAAPDPVAECTRYEALITAKGGIDLQLLGIGHNGHIGFNEPGAAFDSQTRPVRLAPETRQANARFFDDPDAVPTYALTMGIATIRKARSCLLLATGEAKSSAVARLVEGPIGTDCPATALQDHDALCLILDRAAAQGLTPADESTAH
ncbi:glucosamine-6-phosphate deaminase [Halovulum sp. GXIMD14793]